jgi:hypothetical protein
VFFSFFLFYFFFSFFLSDAFASFRDFGSKYQEKQGRKSVSLLK